MKRIILFTVAFLLVLPQALSSAEESCYRINYPKAAEAKARKKEKLRRYGVPERYIKLIDRLPECSECADYAPDFISIMIVENDGDWLSFGWNPTSESIARRDLRAGKIKAFYVMNSAKACTCCNQAEYNKRSDWDEDLKLNKRIVVAYEDAGDLGAEPDYLYKAPEDMGLKPIKPIDIPMPTPARFAQPQCSDCAEESNRINRAGAEIYKLEVEARRLKIEISRFEQMEENQNIIIQHWDRVAPSETQEERLSEASKLSTAYFEKRADFKKELKKIETDLEKAMGEQRSEIAAAKRCEEQLCGKEVTLEAEEEPEVITEPEKKPPPPAAVAENTQVKKKISKNKNDIQAKAEKIEAKPAERKEEPTASPAGNLEGSWRGMISGWGAVVLKKVGPSSYEGTYSGTYGRAEPGLYLNMTGLSGKGEWWEGEGRRGDLYDVALSEDGRILKGWWRVTKREFGRHVDAEPFEWHKQ